MSPVILLILGFSLSFLGTLYLIPKLILVSKDKALFDVPNQRKLHDQPISTLGGITFFIMFWLVSISISDWTHLLELRYVLISSFVLFLVSLSDDLMGVSPVKRLLVQFLVAGLCCFSGFQLEGMYGLFDIWQLPIWMTLPLTLLAISLIVNAYNLIDGVNGLAGSLGLIAMLSFGLLFYLQNEIQWCLTALITAGSVAGFLRYNFGKAVIFMGDNGSTFIGLINAVFFIKFINIDYNTIVSADSQLITGLSILFIPVFDLLRVFTIRILNKRSPLSSDRTHLHHFLFNMGKSHAWICFFILVMHALAYFLGIYFTQEYGITKGLVFTVLVEIAIVVAILGSLQLTAIKQMENERHSIGFME